MDSFYQQIFSILTTPPGSLAYHLVLAFSVAGALQIVVTAWRREGLPQARRWLVGLGLLLIFQLVQFGLAALAWQETFPVQAVLPPVDRGIGLLSLLLVVWLWSFPHPSRLADAATILVGLLLAVFLVFSVIWWGGQSSGLTYNQTWLDFGGQIFGAVLAGLAALGLLIRRPQGWGFGLGMMGLLLLGHLLQVLLVLEGDFAGVARVFQMAAYPLLLLLPQPQAVVDETGRSQAQPAAPNRTQTLELALIQEFARLLVDADMNLFCKKITSAIAHTMLADFCLLITPPDANNQMSVSYGYNLIQEQYVDGFTLDGNVSPMITNSMKRGRPVRLTSANDSPEAYGLARGLGIKRMGHLLHVPVVMRGSTALLGIIVLTPFSNRAWTTDDQLGLVGAAEILAYILNRMQTNGIEAGSLEHMQEIVTEAQQAASQSRQEAVDLQAKIDHMYQQLADARSRAESLAELVASQDMQAQPAPQIVLEAPVQPSSVPADQMVSLEDYTHLESELEIALQEMAATKDLLAKADQEMLKIQDQQPLPSPAAARQEKMPSSEQAEVVTSLAQELRQPMSSIVGYTDLLLGESIGLLGAMQRKFLERVKASIERMGGLVDDLIQTTTVQSRELELSPEMVDLNTIIDDAVASSIARLREKNILLRMDLPDRLPLIRADRDALQQILLHLLQNAGAATPVEGEILLRAQIERKDEQPGFILVQVADSGGGISAEDLPRVFSRLYRADNALIQGVGDTGVGLSIVKALVEAHGGRVWVDSVTGIGSTFSVLLPLTEVVELEREAGGM